VQVAASVSRGNQCRFCTYWHVNIARISGLSHINDVWLTESLSALKGCTARHKAMALWFRDANSMAFLLAYKVCSFNKNLMYCALLFNGNDACFSLQTATVK
jgi:hypothetical protein